MRKLFAALAITLIAGAATPSFAGSEDDAGGSSPSPTWPQTGSRTLLASNSQNGGTSVDMGRQDA
jgi:hypothetical protein